MKNFFIILFFVLFVFSSKSFAFKYAGIGAGPAFGLKGVNNNTSYFINAEWQPSENVGTRFFVGFPDGLWLGVGLNFSFSTTNDFSRSVKLTFNGGIPFIMDIHESATVAFMGVNVGTSLSFDLDGDGTSYFFISPAELFFSPVTWKISSGGGFDLTNNVFLYCSVGFRKSI